MGKDWEGGRNWEKDSVSFSCWVAGCWLLVAGCWLLVAGFSSHFSFQTKRPSTLCWQKKHRTTNGGMLGRRDVCVDKARNGPNQDSGHTDQREEGTTAAAQNQNCNQHTVRVCLCRGPRGSVTVWFSLHNIAADALSIYTRIYINKRNRKGKGIQRSLWQI